LQPFEPTDNPTEQALAVFAPFARAVLPSTVRRIAAWKGLPPGACTDLVAELRQELSLDCIRDPAGVLSLPTLERHQRWMRLAERWVHAQVRYSSHRASDTVTPDDIGRIDPDPDASDADADADLLTLARCRNGRLNLAEAARVGGRTYYAVRRQAETLRAAVADGEQTAFWQRRVAETLTALGADLLQAAGELFCVADVPRRVDPEARLRRLRRLMRRLPRWSLNSAAARTARRLAQRRQALPVAPLDLLTAATELDPGSSAAWLWRLEAHLAAGQTLAAAHALRRARAGAPRRRTACTLAKLRLCEVHRGLPLAIRRLERAVARRPDATLRGVLAAVRAS
jgi:hypothetical protein